MSQPTEYYVYSSQPTTASTNATYAPNVTYGAGASRQVVYTIANGQQNYAPQRVEESNRPMTTTYVTYAPTSSVIYTDSSQVAAPTNALYYGVPQAQQIETVSNQYVAVPAAQNQAYPPQQANSRSYAYHSSVQAQEPIHYPQYSVPASHAPSAPSTRGYEAAQAPNPQNLQPKQAMNPSYSSMSQADLRRQYLQDQGYFTGNQQASSRDFNLETNSQSAAVTTFEADSRRTSMSSRQHDNPTHGRYDELEILKGRIQELESMLKRQESLYLRSREEYQQKIEQLERKLENQHVATPDEPNLSAELSSRLAELDRKYGKKPSNTAYDSYQSSRSLKLKGDDVLTRYEFARSSNEEVRQNQREAFDNRGRNESNGFNVPPLSLPSYAIGQSSDQHAGGYASHRSVSSLSQVSLSSKAEPRPLRAIKGDQIIITVVSARHLVSKIKTSIDPFVVVTYGRQEAKTGVQSRSLKPVWKESFSFTVVDTLEKVKVFVYDADANPPNNVVAKVVIPFQSLQEIAWYELEDEGKYAGEIKIQAKTTTQPKPQVIPPKVEEKPTIERVAPPAVRPKPGEFIVEGL
eukprot:TRINITY_DN10586_c0_g1_i5.p1 TRINITY_DN10586_c0_g1~~TRINITY_DN10586_c0_g1_i5.p1  ORF type:complete len:577 (+),score=93.23 TRINITY_DN10586_c0_g1_i5:47-1777(+)